MRLFADTLYPLLPPLLVWTLAVRRAAARWWLPASLAGALALAILRKATNWINNEYVTLAVMAAGLALATRIAFGLAGAGRPRPPGAGTPDSLTAGLFTLVLALQAVPDACLSAFGIVPGGDTLLSTTSLANLTGYLAALALPALIAWAVARASDGASDKLIRATTAAALALWALGAVLTAVKILYTRKWLPKLPGLFDLIAVSENNRMTLTWALLALACVPPVAARWRKQSTPAPANPAQIRASRAALRSRRRFLALLAGGTALAVGGGLLAKADANTGPALSEPEPLTDAGAHVAVPLAAVNDGHLHRFAHTAADGTQMRFIVIRKPEGAYGVGLDACAVCGPTGYYERDGQVICKMCEVAMNIRTIGFAGGCNPIPLAFTLEGSKLLVAKPDLEAAAEVFA